MAWKKEKNNEANDLNEDADKRQIKLLGNPGER